VYTVETVPENVADQMEPEVPPSVDIELGIVANAIPLGSTEKAAVRFRTRLPVGMVATLHDSLLPPLDEFPPPLDELGGEVPPPLEEQPTKEIAMARTSADDCLEVGTVWRSFPPPCE
jgi:hypothetical protein